LVGMISDHSDFHTQTGFPRNDLQNVGGRPAIGSVVAKLLGPSGSGAPPFISYNGNYPGYLGPVYKPYKPQGGDLKLSGAMTADRLGSRTELLGSLDQIRRDMDHTGQMDALDSYTQRAVEVVTSGKVADALDLNKEDAQVREQYGNNFGQLRTQLPKLDRALSSLLEDLDARGMGNDVTVVMWGEFGRTPRINQGAGRDHWMQLAMAFLAGGGMKLGQAVGVSSKNAEHPIERPVHLQEVFATLYHNLGIDVSQPQLVDPNGRPQFLVDYREPIRELI